MAKKLGAIVVASELTADAASWMRKQIESADVTNPAEFEALSAVMVELRRTIRKEGEPATDEINFRYQAWKEARNSLSERLALYEMLNEKLSEKLAIGIEHWMREQEESELPAEKVAVADGFGWQERYVGEVTDVRAFLEANMDAENLDKLVSINKRCVADIVKKMRGATDVPGLTVRRVFVPTVLRETRDDNA